MPERYKDTKTFNCVFRGIKCLNDDILYPRSFVRFRNVTILRPISPKFILKQVLPFSNFKYSNLNLLLSCN